MYSNTNSIHHVSPNFLIKQIIYTKSIKTHRSALAPCQTDHTLQHAFISAWNKAFRGRKKNVSEPLIWYRTHQKRKIPSRDRSSTFRFTVEFNYWVQCVLEGHETLLLINDTINLHCTLVISCNRNACSRNAPPPANEDLYPGFLFSYSFFLVSLLQPLL